MAAQVEVQTGEVGRTGAGGRLHLSPLTDSINKNVMEIPSLSESHIIVSETNKPAPNPKPRLTPKPFAVEKNPTIKPILAPKPHAKPRPESTRIAGSKSDLPNTPKPAARPVSTNPNRPAATSFRTPNKLKTGQTTKPVIQPFKPVPPLDPGEPSKSTRPVPIGRRKPAVSTLAYSKSLKTYSAAEWSGTTSNKNESGQNKEGPITRAKSMDFLAAVGQHEDEKNKAQPEAAVQLRTQPRSLRPRPVSAIFPASPAKTETPVPAPRWVARRPLSADLTSKFESIGLSLHRKSPKGDTPAEQVPPQDNEQDKTPSCITSESTDGVADPAHSNQNDKKAEETAVNDAEQIKPVTSIKSRINLLVDSSSSPGAAADLLSPVQPSPDSETSVGVKQLIKQLTEDSTPTSIPAAKPALKPRPLPLDLTKKFSFERSPDPVSLTEAGDRHETSRAPQRGAEESTSTPNDQKMFLDLKDSSAEFRKDFIHEGSEAGQPGTPFKESGSGAELHTVRASMFENIVERQSVFMMDQDESPSATRDSPVATFFMRRNDEDGALVTATYKEPASPSSPFWVSHAFDTVLAAEENRAISESIPAAQWEDKAMTLRSRRSERTRPGIQITDPAPAQPASAAEPQPRFLRVGALQKWTTTGFDQCGSLDKGMLKESERDAKVTSDKYRDEVAAAPKRLKILQSEEQQKPRVTYFALTGQMQELASPGGGGTSFVDANLPFKDRSVRSALGGSQGQIFSVRRNPSLEEAFGQISPSQEKCDQFMPRNHIPSMEIRSQMDEQTKQEIIEVKEKKEQQGETERNMTKMNELEREKQKHQKMEKQVNFERMKEWDRQREFERQRQKAFEKEKKEFEEKQQRQKQFELEKQNQEELEKERQQHLQKEKQELERQKEIKREREREKEKQKEMEMQQLVELERQRQREKAEKEAEKLKQMALEQEMQQIKELEKLAKQKEMERKRELEKQRERDIEKEMKRQLDMERQQLEKERLRREQEQERKRKEELERIIEMERQQLVELEKQRQREEEREAEKLKKLALEQEMLKIKELEKERAKQELERQKEIEMENWRQREMEKEKQRQLDLERQQFENERLRREQEKDRQRKELDRLREMEFDKAKETMERAEAEKIRHIAKQQEAERQRLKEKRQKKEEQERLWLDSHALRPQVLDLDSVLRSDAPSLPSPQHSDPSPRWREPYKPAILDIDSFTSHNQVSPSKDLFPASGFLELDVDFGVRLPPPSERDVNWKVPPQTSVGFSSPVWTTSPQDPWELQSVEMSVDKPVTEPKKAANKPGPEQLPFKQEERLPSPQQHRPAFLDELLFLSPPSRKEPQTGISPHELSHSAPGDQIWIPREPQPPKERRGDIHSHRRSHGSQELNRMRSRSMSRRSAPSSSAEEGSLFRMRSRSAHRELDLHSLVQQKQSGEADSKDSGTPVRDTDSQYGTWETGLRTDGSLTPATPSSESNLSPSPRKPTPLASPGAQASQLETTTPDGPSPFSSSESQPLTFPDAPTALLDNSALRSRAQLGKKRAPRTRPSKAARLNAVPAQGDGGNTEDWLYRDSTEAKAENKNDDSESEEQARGADAGAAVPSQPQRVALFPGVDPSALKAQLKKRGDSDNQTDGPVPSSSQISRSPKSPFLPRAARVLPPAGGKENGEEDSPQWLKELKSKKRLSHFDNES